MLVLALDSSTPRVAVAVVEVTGDGSVRIAADRSIDANNRHGELLAPAIADVLDEAGVRPAELAAIACGVGPGPFTGLRVGVVTAASLADALVIPSYAVCSLDAIALAHRAQGELVVCSDARRKQVYWARYDADGRRVEGPDVAPAVDVALRFAGASPRATAVGAGAVMWAEALSPLVVDDVSPWPEAADVARLAAARAAGGAPGEDLVPMYLRRPDAQPPGPVKRVTPA